DNTIQVGDVPTLNQSTTGNAATATALASTPTLCSTGQAPTGILANGNATGCAPPTGTLRILGGGPAAKCQGSVPGAGYSFTSPAPTPTCESDNIQGFLAFTASTLQTINDVIQLPGDWVGTAHLNITAYSSS